MYIIDSTLFLEDFGNLFEGHPDVSGDGGW